MSDFRSDPNFSQRYEMDDHDSRVQWAAVAVILLLVGGLIVAAAVSDVDTQTANNGPAIETTGSGGSTATNPPQRLHRP